MVSLSLVTSCRAILWGLYPRAFAVASIQSFLAFCRTFFPFRTRETVEYETSQTFAMSLIVTDIRAPFDRENFHIDIFIIL